jgi:tRNA U34 5-methylaminomethyl-2-thiouridine-forming methyltransferase MnmC
MAVEIITTSDGSHSLLNKELNETYHSVHGAIQESVHVFIKNGFDFLVQQANPEKMAILEIGFGTGLNALLTVQHAASLKNQITYTSLEAYPVSEEIWSKLNYPSSDEMQAVFKDLHQAAWNMEASITDNFKLTKLYQTLQDTTLTPASFDLVYFDAFAPSKQPEMWTLEVLGKVVDLMRPEAVFVTYCAKGQLKRDLKSLGLTIETLPGPPGKKEMVRAVRR